MSVYEKYLLKPLLLHGFSTLLGSIYRIATKLAFPPEEVVESSLLYFYR
jgi:hypothetical protein